MRVESLSTALRITDQAVAWSSSGASASAWVLRALLQVLFHLQARHALGHPLGRRRAHQVVVEELLHAHGVVALIRRPAQTVVLADVLAA